MCFQKSKISQIIDDKKEQTFLIQLINKEKILKIEFKKNL